MTGPKHLWSGDWDEESTRPAAATPPPERPPARPEPDGPEPRGGRRWLPIAAVVAVVIVAGAFAAELLGGSSKHQTASTAASAQTSPYGPQTYPAPGRRYPFPTQTQTMTSPQPTQTQTQPTTPSNPANPQTTQTTQPTASVDPHPLSWLGMEVITVSPDIAVVDTVTPNSAADRAGINPGDQIQGIDGHAVSGSAGIAKALSSVHKGDQVTLQIARAGSTLSIEVTYTGPPTAYP